MGANDGIPYHLSTFTDETPTGGKGVKVPCSVSE